MTSLTPQEEETITTTSNSHSHEKNTHKIQTRHVNSSWIKKKYPKTYDDIKSDHTGFSLFATNKVYTISNFSADLSNVHVTTKTHCRSDRMGRWAKYSIPCTSWDKHSQTANCCTRSRWGHTLTHTDITSTDLIDTSKEDATAGASVDPKVTFDLTVYPALSEQTPPWTESDRIISGHGGNGQW